MPDNGAENIFHRVEQKYIINRDQFDGITKVLPEFMKLDDYGGTEGLYNIRSLYYDTPDNAFIRETLANKGYKEKIRIRSYGDPEPNDMIYLEIKKKILGKGNKRRFKMPLSDVYNFMENGLLDSTYKTRYTQVLREVQALKDRHGVIRPAAVISCDRLAFNGLGDSGLRISFDANVRGRTYDLMLEYGGYGEYLIEPENIIMEIKALNSLPLWLTHILSIHRASPGNFSKYRSVYYRTLSEKMLTRLEKGALHV